MLGSDVLDVALGLSFLYLLLSLLVTALNEFVEAILKRRAKDLELGIRTLLNDPVLTKKLYDHMMVGGLYTGDINAGTRDLPSYIPARNFALALMDVLHSADPTAAGAAAGADTAVAPVSGATGAAGPPPAQAPAATPAGPMPATLTGLRTAVLALPPQSARDAILTLIDAAGGDPALVRKNIEDWFNSAMDRVSGWYKRRVQWFTLGFGVAAAVLLNADSFVMANALRTDKALRESVAVAATKYATDHAPDDADKKARPKADDKSSGQDDELKRRLNDLGDQVRGVRGYGWPLGWDRGDDGCLVLPKDFAAWLSKIAGWAVTALAISLGAPFWFDVLNKIIVIRSTVKPREKSPDEPPVDK